MSFEQFLPIYIGYTIFLPLLSIPLLLIFVAVGKGRSKSAWYLSLSAPGLIIPVVALHGATLSDVSIRNAILLALALLLDPAIWVFPAVCVVHGLRMMRGNWGEMGRWQGIVCCALLGLYALNTGLVNIDPD